MPSLVSGASCPYSPPIPGPGPGPCEPELSIAGGPTQGRGEPVVDSETLSVDETEDDVKIDEAEGP